jgi:hypothetical protein
MQVCLVLQVVQVVLGRHQMQAVQKLEHTTGCCCTLKHRLLLCQLKLRMASGATAHIYDQQLLIEELASNAALTLYCSLITKRFHASKPNTAWILYLKAPPAD